MRELCLPSCPYSIGQSESFVQRQGTPPIHGEVTATVTAPETPAAVKEHSEQLGSVEIILPNRETGHKQTLQLTENKVRLLISLMLCPSSQMSLPDSHLIVLGNCPDRLPYTSCK